MYLLRANINIDNCVTSVNKTEFVVEERTRGKFE